MAEYEVTPGVNMQPVEAILKLEDGSTVGVWLRGQSWGMSGVDTGGLWANRTPYENDHNLNLGVLARHLERIECDGPEYRSDHLYLAAATFALSLGAIRQIPS